MSSRVRLFLVVALLCATGIGVAAYKNIKLGVPLRAGEKTSTWLVEAKVSFVIAEPGSAIVSLALPSAAEDQSMGQEAGSLGYGYSTNKSEGMLRAVWSQREPNEGPQALYYRIRFPERFKTGASGVAVKGDPPVAESPGLTGPTEKAAEALIDTSRAVSADVDTFFTHLFLQIARDNSSQELLLLRRHYETVERVSGDNLLIAMGIDLLRMAGIPARLAHGIRLDDTTGAQQAMPLIEYCDGTTWRVKNPLQPSVSLRTENVFVWNRGGAPLIEVFGGENSKVVFTVVKDNLSLEAMSVLRESPFMASTILALPVSERAIFRYVVLIPLGAFVVVILRNLVGVPT